MQTHYSLSDELFEQQFADTTLNPHLFSHEAHLRLAWIHIGKYGTAQAVENVYIQIQRFDRTHDDGTKFNQTVTVASVKAVAHFMAKSGADNFKDFIDSFPRLRYHLKDLLAQHYSWDIFADQAAKSEYLAPDLLAFS